MQKNKLSTDRIIAMICISVGTVALMVTAVMTGLLLRDKDIPSHAVINSGHVDGLFPVISVSGGNTFAIAQNGDLYSWGNNEFGPLGLGNSGSGTEKNTPQHVNNGNRKYKAIASGNHTLALAVNGDLYSWGYNVSGQLGLGFTGSSSDANPTPLYVGDGGRKYKAIAANGSANHILALAENGDLYAWGANNLGQLGLGYTSNYGENPETPQYVSAGGRKYKAIAVGSSSSFAIAENGDLYSWGYNGLGYGLGLGEYTNISYDTPQYVSDGSRKYKAIASYGYSLAIAENGDVYTWGYGACGYEPGYMEEFNYCTPKLVGDGSRQYKAIAAGSDYSFAIAENGDLYAWGHVGYGDGRLGIGYWDSYIQGGYVCETPTHVSDGGRKYSSIAASYSHSFAVAENGDLYTWGSSPLSYEYIPGASWPLDTPALVPGFVI